MVLHLEANFTPPEISLQRLQLETSNSVHELATWSISLLMTNYPQMGVVRVTWPISTFWGPGHIFRADQDKHFKLVCRLNIKSTGLTHLIVLQHGVHLGSRDLLKFREISANISETVQDRHIVTLGTDMKSQESYRMVEVYHSHQYWWPWVTLNVTLAVSKSFQLLLINDNDTY